MYVYNVVVLNNINGEGVIENSKSISLKYMVSDCVYVFKREGIQDGYQTMYMFGAK